jgi:hypothetical protein
MLEFQQELYEVNKGLTKRWRLYKARKQTLFGVMDVRSFPLML